MTSPEVQDRLQKELGGTYVIERELGGGGMSRVFVAADGALGRKVVVKVLRPELAEGLSVERFKREVRLAARLQHPHIVPLLAAGALDGGVLYYTMPFVEGESLRARLEGAGALPIPQVVRILCDVASALAYAHRAGVVHRDVKPENILLGEGGAVVADFGIAKAISASRDDHEERGTSQVSTLTAAGTSLGTPAYMAPEQAAGDAVDHRADLYALGVIAYEMLTGEPPFRGRTAQQVMAAHATQDPEPIERRRATIPPDLTRVVGQLLAKNPADRPQSAADVVRALQEGALALPMTHPRRRWYAFAPWVVAVIAASVAGWLLMQPSTAPRVTRFELAVPDSARLRSTAGGQTVAISPDGSRLVYTGGPESSGQLFLHNLDELEPRPIAGTDRAQSPEFSPDGRSVLFLTDGRLKRVDIAGGAPVTLSDSGGTASWGDGGIVYARPGGVYWVSPQGGPVRLIASSTAVHGITVFALPSWLPGGKAVLVMLRRPGTTVASSHVAVLRVSNGEVIDLGVEGVNPHYLSTGHVIFGRPEGRVFGMAFDAKRFRVSGPVVPLIEDVVVNNGGATQVAVSRAGTMAYRSGRFLRKVMLVDRRGAATPLLEERREYAFPKLSPDGTRLAVTIGASTITSETWVFDTRTGALTTLTHGGGERPEWTPDGRQIVTVRQDTITRLMIQPWDGAGTPAPYAPLDRAVLEVSLPNGRAGFMAARIGGGGQRDIWIAPVDSPSALRPFVASQADEFSPSVSPDGRWLAYVSNESGRYEVYVRSMTGAGGRVQVSTNGAVEPLWSPTGRELFYRADRKIIAARISWSEGAAGVQREPLFDDIYVSNGSAHITYSATPDGNHFVFLQSAGGEPKTIVTLNWLEEVKRRMDAARAP